MASVSLAQQRLAAWAIDFLLVLGLGVLLSGLGWIASTAYWLCRDGLFEGQSVGKRVMKLRVVVLPDQTRCTYRTSIIRNLLWVVPLINLVAGLAGLYLLFSDPAGRHWGDRLADTRVVNT